MLISQAELAAILRSSIPGAARKEKSRIETIVDTIERTGICAQLDSEYSIKLKRIIDAHKEILSKDTVNIFNDIDIYGVDLDICNAFARIEKGRKQIVVFEGILYLIRYYSDLVTILPLLKHYYPNETIEVNGVEENLPQYFSTAGFSLIVDYLENGGALIDLSSILGPVARKNVELGFLGAIMFLLVHEAGHIKLGHCELSQRSERYVGSLAIKEEVNSYQNQEFEADEFAFLSINEEIRSLFISSIMFFMGPFAYSEIFHHGKGRTHPLAANRLSKIADKISFPDDPRLETAVKEILLGEVDRFNGFYDQRREYNGDARKRVREVMPFELAHFIIRQVMEKIQAMGGVLEVVPEK